MSGARTAALAALTAAVIAIGAIVITSRSRPTYTLHAMFANVNGLVETGKVEVAGFKVGEITGISVRVGHYPEVTMKISTAYRVRQGARAVIELGSLAGQLNRYIALSGGTGPPLPAGATIPASRTSEPVEIDQFLSALNPRTRAELRALLRDAVHTLKGRGPDIQQALRHSAQAFGQTANLFEDVAADGPALRLLVARAAAGARELAAEPADVRDTVSRLETLLQTTARRQVELAQSLGEFPGAMHSTDAALIELQNSIPVLNRLLAAAPPALAAVDPFAHALEVTAPRTIPLFRSALELVGAFRQSSPAITQLFGSPLPQTLANLNAGLRGANPLLDQLRARAPDVLGWIPLLGDVTANYNATGHGALVLPSIHPAPQQPITPPSCQPGWLLRPFDRIPGELACDPWTGFDKSFVGGGRNPTSYLTAAEQAPHPGEFP